METQAPMSGPVNMNSVPMQAPSGGGMKYLSGGILVVVIAILAYLVFFRTTSGALAGVYAGRAEPTAGQSCSGADLTLTIQGETLSGSGLVDGGNQVQITGTVDSDKLSGAWYSQGKSVGTFSGTGDSAKLLGTWSDIYGCSGAFRLMSSTNAGTTQSPATAAVSETISFPWGRYSAYQEAKPSTHTNTIVARKVVFGTNATANVVVAETLELGTGAKVLQRAYVASAFNMGTNSSVNEAIHVQATTIDTALGYAILKHTVLSAIDWTNAALAVAGGSASTNTTATPKPATQTATPPVNPLAGFVGSWSGRFVPKISGCPGGAVAFVLASNGQFQGPVTTDEGDIYYGGGSITSTGSLRGGWSYTGGTISFTGTLRGNGTGSGTYSDNSGCSGSFSVSR